MDKKLFLIACFHASNGDSTNLSKIFKNLCDSQDFINAIIVLWPELDDPMNLKFLFQADSLKGREIEMEKNDNDDDLVVSQISNHPDLLYMVEMDDETIEKRYDEIRSYIDSRFKKLGLSSNELNWFQRRVIICNEVNPYDTSAYEPLWELIKGQDSSIDEWMNGIVKPLSHYNKRLSTQIKIRDFEHIISKEDNMLKWFNSSDPNVLKNELIPYLTYDTKFYKLFLNDYYNKDKFVINDPLQYDKLNTLFKMLTNINGRKDLFEIESRTLDILFANSKKIVEFMDMKQIFNDFLNQIDDNVTLDKYSISNKEIKMYYQSVENYSSMVRYSLLDIYNISKSIKEVQFTYFTNLCDIILRCDNTKFLELLNPIKIFNKIDYTDRSDKNQIIKIVVEAILQLEKYSLIPLIVERTSNEGDSEKIVKLLVDKFWQYFHNANRINSIEFSNAETLLNYITKYDTNHKVSNRISELISLCRDLYLSSKWKFQNTSSDKTNISSTATSPKNILKYQECPLEIIRILMELNPKFYLNDVREVTWSLWNRILVSLEYPERDTDYADLLSLHIDYSLVNNDFSYASNHVDELLKDEKNGQRHWLTIFQVGKYCSMNSDTNTEDEIYLEMRLRQMQILSKLLKICPEEEIEVVTNQWNNLNLQIQNFYQEE